MYDCGKKLASWTSLLIFAALLTACGGKDDDETTTREEPTSITPNTSATASSAVQLNATSSNATQSSSPAKISSSVAIIQEKDSTPPSTTQLLLQQLSETSVTLIWDDATDNSGISGYKIERNGQLIATLNYPTRLFADSNLQPAKAYTYTIKAVDYSGNDSNLSSPFTVRTLANASSQASAIVIETPPSSIASTNKSSAASSIKPSSADASSTRTSSKPASSASSSNKSTLSSIGKSSSSSKASSSLGNSSSSINSTSSASSISSNSNSSAQASSAPAKTDNAAQQNKVTITWAHPSQRENGLFLELDEIGGYELRYRTSTDSAYTYITLSDNKTVEYTLEGNSGLEVEIAVFDINGVYSRFVRVSQ